jgi:hypothetical protein
MGAAWCKKETQEVKTAVVKIIDSDFKLVEGIVTAAFKRELLVVTAAMENDVKDAAAAVNNNIMSQLRAWQGNVSAELQGRLMVMVQAEMQKVLATLADGVTKKLNTELEGFRKDLLAVAGATEAPVETGPTAAPAYEKDDKKV